MSTTRDDQVAVIFVSTLTGDDEEGYEAAAQAMAQLASEQPGYCGLESARGSDGRGITVSYWADDNAAKAWRDNPEHSLIREKGRAFWYRDYDLQVARVERSYGWSRDG